MLFVLFFAISLFAEPLKPDQYTKPSAQDSVYKTPWGIDPAARETDAGRWVLPHRELMQRTYDISGQKSEWVLGTSILGAPELDPDHMGMGSIQTRYPSKLAGLFTTRLGYDATALGLNGENGILFEERKGIPVDTPITDLNWERPAFGGNALRLDFRRLVTDSVSLEFGLASHSDIDSKEYSYQNVTHSPYFSLGRDSTQIPFAGRNIAMNSMHIQPILTWRFGFGKAFVKMNYLSLHNADNTNHQVLLDTLDKAVRTFQTDPYVIDIHTVGYGAGIELYPIKNLTLSTDIAYTEHEIEEDSLPHIFKGVHEYEDTLGIPQRDTIYHDTLRATTYESILGGFGATYHMFLNPSLKFKYEFLNTDNTYNGSDTTKSYFQDRETGYLQLSDTLWNRVLFRTQTGMQRNSSVRNQVDYAPAYSADLLAFLPYHLRANVGFRHDNKFPDVGQLKIDETGRLAFHRKDLAYEERDRYAFNLGYQQREVFYGLGLRYENVDNLIKPRWVKWGHVDTTNTYEEVYTWTNIDNVSSLDWLLQLGFRLGNWKFFVERGQTLDRSRNLIDTPELYYKGSIHWQNRFVSERLGVSVRVDWQWFGERYDCTINEDGNPELEFMKKYLALDFEARMQILTFELYTRIENFNHSIYMPASGYTPEGLRFAYGIVWSFRN
ncbi:hypothetical protein [Fibrobacter sp.]|uniref:hypothetical protein n=1 Tax=Fibrobacter sp. TaxID=35828 RepID=UPI00388E0934